MNEGCTSRVGPGLLYGRSLTRPVRKLRVTVWRGLYYSGWPLVPGGGTVTVQCEAEAKLAGLWCVCGGQRAWACGVQLVVCRP